MSDTANTQSNQGQAGLLTAVLTPADLVNQVNATANVVVPQAVASVVYRVDPMNRHLYRSRSGGPEQDLGLVGGTRFWGPYATTGDFPLASDGVMGGDLTFNQNNKSLYVWRSGQWSNVGSIQGAAGLGVASAAVDGSGNLTLTLTDSSTLGPWNVKGQPGTNGTTPALAVGTVTTLAAGAAATVTRRSGSPDAAPIFDFGIPAGAQGVQGPSGVLAASAPLSYNAATKTVSIDLSAYATVASLSGYATTAALNSAISGVTLTFNAPLSKSGTTVSIPAATAVADGYMPASAQVAITALQTAVTALQSKAVKGGLGTKTVNLPISVLGGSQDVTIALNNALPDTNYLPLFGITSATGLALSAFTLAFKSKTTNTITVTLSYPVVSLLSTVTIAAFGLETA